MWIILLVIRVWLFVVWILLLGWRRICVRLTVFLFHHIQHLVKLAFIEPYAAAGGAVVDLDGVSFCHQERFITVRTFHDVLC